MKILPSLAALAWAVLSLSAHGVGSLADISIHDRATGRALQVYWHEGIPYVAGQPGNEYQIVVRNHAHEDLLGVVSVDGVNVLSAETASLQQSGYVVPRREQLDIRGWRKSMGETAAFYFTSLGDSYASRTGRHENVGVIGVALFKRKTLPPVSIQREKSAARDTLTAPASAEAPSANRLYANPSLPLGTGHGRREDSQARFVSFERASSEPAETITLRYDSRSNLIARGIIQAAYVPRAFPGFVPDPPPAPHF